MTYLDFLAHDGSAHRVIERTDAGFVLAPAVDDDAGFEAFQAVVHDAIERADDSYRALPHRSGEGPVAGWDAVTIELLS